VKGTTEDLFAKVDGLVSKILIDGVNDAMSDLGLGVGEAHFMEIDESGRLVMSDPRWTPADNPVQYFIAPFILPSYPIVTGSHLEGTITASNLLGDDLENATILSEDQSWIVKGRTLFQGRWAVVIEGFIDLKIKVDSDRSEADISGERTYLIDELSGLMVSATG